MEKKKSRVSDMMTVPGTIPSLPPCKDIISVSVKEFHFLMTAIPVTEVSLQTCRRVWSCAIFAFTDKEPVTVKFKRGSTSGRALCISWLYLLCEV